MKPFDRDALRQTYRRSVLRQTVLFVPFALGLIIANLSGLDDTARLAVLAGALACGIGSAFLGYPALRIMILETRRHPEFADELWRMNVRRAFSISWLVVFFTAAAIALVTVYGWVPLSGATASALIAVLMIVSFQGALVWYELA
ncbi:MAG: hypothetical protein AAGL24_10915 [Pseudomonadota bacterium]